MTAATVLGALLDGIYTQMDGPLQTSRCYSRLHIRYGTDLKTMVHAQ
jgi:hypothetical protein